MERIFADIFSELPTAEQLESMTAQEAADALQDWEQKLEAGREQIDRQMDYESRQVDLWGRYARTMQWGMFLIAISCLAGGVALFFSDRAQIMATILTLAALVISSVLATGHRRLWNLAGRLSGLRVKQVAARAGFGYQPRSG